MDLLRVGNVRNKRPEGSHLADVGVYILDTRDEDSDKIIQEEKRTSPLQRSADRPTDVSQQDKKTEHANPKHQPTCSHSPSPCSRSQCSPP